MTILFTPRNNTPSLKLTTYPETLRHQKNKRCCSYPELLDQVHVSSLIFLHAALGNTGHIGSQRAVYQHAQHVQHSGEKLTVEEKHR